MKIHIVPCGDQYFLALRRRNGSNALVYTTDNYWNNPMAMQGAPICMFDTEKDARDVAEGVVHVPYDPESLTDVLGPEED
ncbi:MAG: hypothetical protein ABFE07_28360 [Armatimonadia bacterium]